MSDSSGILLSMLGSTVVATFVSTGISTVVVYFKNRRENFEYQDEQTKWVDRLLNVVKTPNSEIKEDHVLEVISCLRPFGKQSSPNNARGTFMKDAIQFCNSRYNDDGDFISLSSKQKVNLRLIGNILLKEHWEHLESKNKLRKDKDKLKELDDMYREGSTKLTT